MDGDPDGTGRGGDRDPAGTRERHPDRGATARHPIEPLGPATATAPLAPLHLFEGFGIELEYMIVDEETLAVRHEAATLLGLAGGAPGDEAPSDVSRGPIEWSNELVDHVIELKTAGPAPSLHPLPGLFRANVAEIAGLLAGRGARLLGTAAHPLMDPFEETRLWPYEYSRVYQLYDRIFGCRGHGWSNLQSAHLNLPFTGDEEFARLHAAVRLVLPLVPGIAASSPILDGEWTGLADARLEAYRHNQDRIPEIAGRVIPESMRSEEEYRKRIFAPIERAMAPLDPEGILDPHFVNSRGAIARFDRGSIEIRLVDVQECVSADLAIHALLVEVIRDLAEERWGSVAEVAAYPTSPLVDLLDAGIRDGEKATITDPAYLELFGFGRDAASGAGRPPSAAAPTGVELWRHLVDSVADRLPSWAAPPLDAILDQGTLSTRILRALGHASVAGPAGTADQGPERSPDHPATRAGADSSLPRDAILRVYRALAECLHIDEPFRPI